MAILEKKWPRTHKVLLVLTVLLLVIAVCIYVFVLMPLYDRYDETQAEQEKEEATVKKSEWDSSETGIANAMKLYTLAIGNKKSPAAKAKSDELLDKATAHLQKMIDDVKEASKNPSITKDGKKTYSDKYDEVKKYLQGKDIELVPAVYGLGRVSEGNYYNMTLKLLLTRDLVDLLLKHRLTIDKTVETYLPEADSMFADIQGNEEAKKIYASELRTQPVKPYVMRQEEAPYLLELAIRATVVGELADFAAFASDLQKENRCYSLTNFEMQTIKPVLKNERKAQLISSQEDSKRVHLEKVRVTFVCTGFVKPEVDKMQEELEKLKKPSEKASRNPAGNDSEETEKPLGI